MKAAHQSNLIRKQYLVSESNVRKLESIAREKRTSATEIVRLAIDAYNPEEPDSLSNADLMELVDTRLKEAINSTVDAQKKVAVALEKIN